MIFNTFFFNYLKSRYYYINPFVPNALFLYPLKTSENCKIFWYFQGVQKGYIGKE